MVNIVTDALAEKAQASLHQIRRDAEHAEETSAQNLKEALSLKQEADGSVKIPLVGISIPGAVAPWLNLGYNTFIADITSKVGEKSYQGGYWLSHRALKHDVAHAHKVAAGVQIAAGLALLVGKPLTSLVNLSKKHHHARKAVMEDLKPIVEATGANALNNEIIRYECQRVSDEALKDLKVLAPELPILALQSLIVVDSHRQKNSSEFRQQVEQKYSRSPASAEPHHHEEVRHVAHPAPKAEEHTSQNEKSLMKRWLGKFSKDPNKVMMFASAAGELTKQSIQAKLNDGKKTRHASAWEMIKNTRDEVMKAYGKDNEHVCSFTTLCAEDITISPLDQQVQQRDMNLSEYIVSIFQQNERDAGRGEIKTAVLRDLESAAELIANTIADGSLDANALVNLVGDGNVVSHTGGKRRVASTKVIEAELERLKPMMAHCTSIDPKEFFDHFDEAGVMREVLKKNLKEMHGLEKSCFVALFSDAILKEAGMSTKDIVYARRQAHGHMSKIIENGIREFADKSREELQKFEFSDDDINRLLKLHHELEQGNSEAIRFIVEGHGRELVQNILGAAVLKELSKDKDAWVKRVKASEKPKPEKVKAKEEAENPQASETKEKLSGAPTGFADDEKKRESFAEHAVRPENDGPAARL